MCFLGNFNIAFDLSFRDHFNSGIIPIGIPKNETTSYRQDSVLFEYFFKKILD